jgi:hypothetical protein
MRNESRDGNEYPRDSPMSFMKYPGLNGPPLLHIFGTDPSGIEFSIYDRRNEASSDIDICAPGVPIVERE